MGPCNAMLALLFDIHGNLPALEAVLDGAPWGEVIAGRIERASLD